MDRDYHTDAARIMNRALGELRCVANRYDKSVSETVMLVAGLMVVSVADEFKTEMKERRKTNGP